MRTIRLSDALLCSISSKNLYKPYLQQTSALLSQSLLYHHAFDPSPKTEFSTHLQHHSCADQFPWLSPSAFFGSRLQEMQGIEATKEYRHQDQGEPLMRES